MLRNKSKIETEAQEKNRMKSEGDGGTVGKAFLTTESRNTLSRFTGKCCGPFPRKITVGIVQKLIPVCRVPSCAHHLEQVLDKMEIWASCRESILITSMELKVMQCGAHSSQVRTNTASRPRKTDRASTPEMTQGSHQSPRDHVPGGGARGLEDALGSGLGIRKSQRPPYPFSVRT